MIRILGIDCGSSATGYGLIDSDGRSSVRVASGVIRSRPRSPFPERLRRICDSLRNLIRAHSPAAMAVEGVFHSVNPRSALQLGHVRGIALLAAAESELPVYEYSALQIKSSVVGYGHAEKTQVQAMVSVLLHLPEKPPEDAADALAVALCHAHHSWALTRLNRSASARPAPPRSQRVWVAPS
jgi:crossover junction endodeoxyribonuclease RuvC